MSIIEDKEKEKEIPFCDIPNTNYFSALKEHNYL